ncbi:heme-dependent catalase [Plenodomus tracheiphilus IPT5]|uniref:Heme-dependent catalase n=1 Tax=Plenodomus tracheiphilus IPT5 TaxID=1408161 RepID=A0A6A7AUS8_9PLEO|nr:heme-dependent catalase [Plenodomus tracheiphilus IPT5]
MSLMEAYNTVKRAISSAPPNDAYLCWDAPGVETIEENETETARKIGATMNKMQQHNFDQHRHAFRATHVKTQGIVKGTLTIQDDLPTHLQQGLFKTPGKTYNVAARYASEPVFLQVDQEPGPRGLGLRIFDVEGERLEGADQDATTQDFFFNNAPMIELTDNKTCLEIMELREKYFDSPMKLGAATKLRTDALKQSAPFMLPNTNMISHSFYTQSAFRYGTWYGHMALFPVLEKMENHDEKVKSGDSREALRDWLAEYFTGHGAKYEFKIQLGTSPEHHPTEDASVVWDEVTAPYQTIATIEFPPQNALSAARTVFWEDRMKLSPWDALVDHKPLGGINRLRKIVYEMSKQKRENVNATKTRAVNSLSGVLSIFQKVSSTTFIDKFNMRFDTLAFISLVTGVQAIGRAIVTNQCDEPLYLWSVGGSISSQRTLTKDTSYSETFSRDPVSGGVAIKITGEDGGLFKPNVSQVIFAYSLDASQVWYDMSDIFGDGFAGRTLTIKPTDSSCEDISWYAGKSPAGSQVKTCQAEADLELTFCTNHCLPSWYPCGNNAPNDTRTCCTHCIGSHHCVAAP